MSEALGLGLVLGMLGMMAMRTVGPVKALPNGKQLMVVQSRFIDRLLLHRFQLISLMAILALGSGTAGPRWISYSTFLVAVGGAVGLLLVALKDLVTTDGVKLLTSFVQSWEGFTSLQIERQRV